MAEAGVSEDEMAAYDMEAVEDEFCSQSYQSDEDMEDHADEGGNVSDTDTVVISDDDGNNQDGADGNSHGNENLDGDTAEGGAKPHKGTKAKSSV